MTPSRLRVHSRRSRDRRHLRRQDPSRERRDRCRHAVVPFTAKVSLDVGPELEFPYQVPQGPVRARLIQDPRLSPDGTRLAFSVLTKIYVMDAARRRDAEAADERRRVGVHARLVARRAVDRLRHLVDGRRSHLEDARRRYRRAGAAHRLPGLLHRHRLLAGRRAHRRAARQRVHASPDVQRVRWAAYPAGSGLAPGRRRRRPTLVVPARGLGVSALRPATPTASTCTRTTG